MDANGNKLVAFGKGIGFPKTPYELKDMATVSMTFYQLENFQMELLSNIPQDFFEIGESIYFYAQKTLSNPINRNVVFNLADHLHFAVERFNKGHVSHLFIEHDIAFVHPKEVEVGQYALKLIRKRLGIILPKPEAYHLALHLLNAEEIIETKCQVLDIESIISKVSDLIEQEFEIVLSRDSYSYYRFATHLRYFWDRLSQKEIPYSNLTKMFDYFEENFSDEVKKSDKIFSYIEGLSSKKLGLNEKVYLLIHILRLIEKEGDYYDEV